VGESGCGKSTVGRAIIRLEKVTAGHVWFTGRDITQYTEQQLRPVRPQMQMVFQDPYSSLNPRRSIDSILREVLRTHHIVPPAEISREIDRLLNLIGLQSASKNRFPHEFSGGQRQRISIARALALRPKLIICDEAVSALDVSIQAQILNLLGDLQKEFGLTYLFIAHGLGAVKYISDRIAVMYLGKIVELAFTEELFNNPLHPYTQALLSAFPVPDPRNREQQRIVLSGNVPDPSNPPAGCSFSTRCPFAKPVCSTQEPSLVNVDGHEVACHFSAEHLRRNQNV
jgi:oligopeptide transport system ATP-binding protein